jgi:hypothetical protein
MGRSENVEEHSLHGSNGSSYSSNVKNDDQIYSYSLNVNNKKQSAATDINNGSTPQLLKEVFLNERNEIPFSNQ